MTAEERRAETRERVKAWKAANGWSLRQQRKRRYARKKAVAKAGRGGVQVEFEMREKREPTLVQETYLEHPALSEGEPEVVREHAREVARRRGVGVPEGLMEPEQEEVRRDDARRVVEAEAGNRRGTGDGTEADAGVSGAWSGEPVRTAEQAYEWVEQKKRARGSGVEVDLVL